MRPNAEQILIALQQSRFRRRFRLQDKDLAYARAKGTEVLLAHAREFIRNRLAPAQPPNDGRQTPMRGHPAFIAQHATATCCRKCLEKWHGIPRRHALTHGEVDYIIQVIAAWLAQHELPMGGTEPADALLFE